MIKTLFKFSALIFLNYIVIFQSKNINTQQIATDMNRVIKFQDFNEIIINFFICLTVAMTTLWFLYIFKPFIEVYLLYYFKYGFYFLINFISISSVYIMFRVYGYSRFYLLIYLFTASMMILLSDKIKN
jgi:hypothetical protein